LATPASRETSLFCCKTLMKPFFIWVSIPLEVTLKIPQKEIVKKISVSEKSSIGSIITDLGYDLDTIVVLNNDKPIPETEKITENLTLTVLEITSKG